MVADTAYSKCREVQEVTQAAINLKLTDRLL